MPVSRRSFLNFAAAAVATSVAGGASAASSSSIHFTPQEQLVVDYFAARGLKKFLMLSEARGALLAIENGHVAQRVSALSGKMSGDYAAVNNKVTPAGFYDLKFSPDQSDPDAYMQFYRRADNSIDVIHPQINVPGQNRAQRLATGTPDEKRISGGCVNVSLQDYRAMSAFARAARQPFSSVDGKKTIEASFLIILPENVGLTRKILEIPPEFKPGLN